MAYFCDVFLALYRAYLLYIIPLISIRKISVTYSMASNHKVVTRFGEFCDVVMGMGGIELQPFGVLQKRIL